MGTEAEDILAFAKERYRVAQRMQQERQRHKQALRELREKLAAQDRASGKHSGANPTVLHKRKVWSIGEELAQFEDKGKQYGRVNGGYIAGDLSELRKVILLCPMCKHGFDWKKHNYYNVYHYDRIHAVGKCDVCRSRSNRLSIYLHETHVGESWTPRARLAEQRRRATLVGG